MTAEVLVFVREQEQAMQQWVTSRWCAFESQEDQIPPAANKRSMGQGLNLGNVPPAAANRSNGQGLSLGSMFGGRPSEFSGDKPTVGQIEATTPSKPPRLSPASGDGGADAPPPPPPPQPRSEFL